MTNYEFFVKGDEVHCLINSINIPNYLLPVKAVIEDISFKSEIPEYLIKVTHFYEDLIHLKRISEGMTYRSGFNNKYKDYVSFKSIHNKADLTDMLKNRPFKVVLNPLNIFKSKSDMQKAFNALNYYFVLTSLVALKENTTRQFYTGELKFAPQEFNDRLFKFFGDTFPNEKGYTFENVLSDIATTRLPHNKKVNTVKNNNRRRN